MTNDLQAILRKIQALRARAADAPPAHAPELLDGLDPTRLSVGLAAVSLMRKLRGNDVAILLWRMLGLPAPTNLIEEADDGLVDRISRWMDSYDHHPTGFTSAEVEAAIGITNSDRIFRLRLGDILRMFGYERRKKRRGNDIVYEWQLPRNYVG